MSWTILFTASATIVACSLAITWWRRQSSLKVLLAREVLDDDKLYALFYGDTSLPKNDVLRAWHEIATALHMPAGCLRPTDRFGKDIGRYWITSDDLDVLAAKAKKLSTERGLIVDLEALSTVDEFVRCFASPGKMPDSK
jgi:hypothetical protein